MSSEIITRAKETPANSAEISCPRPEALEQVLKSVRRDSREKPDEYLEESTVPHGGE